MKKGIPFVLMAVFFFVFLFASGNCLARPVTGGCGSGEITGGSFALPSGMYISAHLMGLNPPPANCGVPQAYTQFYTGDQVMHWAYVGWCNRGDVFEWHWFNSLKNYDPSYYTIPYDGYWCVWSYWPDGIPDVTGQWGVHFFYNVAYQNSDSFKVISAKVSVVIIPGIMGSLSSCLFDSACPPNYEFDPVGPVNEILGPGWVLDPVDFDWGVVSHKPTYQSLIQAFRRDGYVLNRTLFLAPYDWRRKNQKTAETTLSAVINKAKLASGRDEVDVVCHSMGCLVLEDRAIRLNKSDVRKTAMVGPPNSGSANAYYIWEGGDFSLYDPAMRTCFINPLISHMKIAAGYQGLPNYKFIQEKVPSVRQLLPVDDYLLKRISGILVPVSIDDMHWKNTFIPTLDYSRLVDKIPVGNMRIFAGTGIATLKSIRVKESAVSPRWIDGVPLGNVYDTGDGTVTLDNAKLGSISVVSKRGAEHGDLTNRFQREIVSFISGTPIQSQIPDDQEALSEEISAPGFANIFLVGAQGIVSGKESRIRMGLITNEGWRVGLFPFEEKRLKETEYSYYGGSPDKTGAVGIYNATPGEYVLTVSTREEKTEFVIGISWRQGEKEQESSVRGVIKAGEVRTYKIKIGETITVSE